MKQIIAAVLLFLATTEMANAVVYCAAGAYHAGCVRRPPVGAAVVRRPVGAYGYHGGAVYHRPGTTVIHRY